ncbi:D-2-hydroxyacid dehydrogenase [Natronogracilivirga saccharolytica]|uniref:D-isomer specific 2-hydroxyacid dehydrogenase NAD-binding domain-containing protein n=1 Tax=Natronogracilivirga saccharolytica TaxID=2812953 RepID=A0A8J7RJC3_9BACT|nr:D-2-hydroxyacid dehydrogenase [Natronogracilivirga saccharolytica]MBP3192292.1 hypothetical protein [Natronogracilivirga saccharolytica]
MQKKALFLQKKHILEDQQAELTALFREYLPGYQPFFASSAGDVSPGDFYHLVITSFHDFFPEVMKKISKPEHLHFTGSGTDKLDDMSQELDLDGVTITNSAGVNAVTIAEHVIAGILTFAKNLHLYRDQQNNKVWKRRWHTEISGQSVTIVGLGSIGMEVARRCRALGLQVTGCVRTMRIYTGIDSLCTLDELPEVASQSDYVVLCVPLTRQTKGLIDRHILGRFKKTAVLVNVSRGEVVDEQALTDALQHYRIKGAVLDVFHQEPLPEDHPFWQLDNVLLTPHVAGTTQHYMRNLFRILHEKLQ